LGKNRSVEVEFEVEVDGRREREVEIEYQDLVCFLVVVAARSRGMTAVVLACGWPAVREECEPVWLRSSSIVELERSFLNSTI
jgi:hypothetical protein